MDALRLGNEDLVPDLSIPSFSSAALPSVIAAIIIRNTKASSFASVGYSQIHPFMIIFSQYKEVGNKRNRTSVILFS